MARASRVPGATWAVTLAVAAWLAASAGGRLDAVADADDAPPTPVRAGQRVFARPGTALKAFRSQPDPRPDDPGARQPARVYRVELVEGGWLWLVAERGEGAGWARADRAIPLDRAAEYYSALVRLGPSAPRHNDRGIARLELGWTDDALADFSEAIRLDPGDPTYRANRGDARERRGDHLGAIADLSEAIRLDPKVPATFRRRGGARLESNDLLGAVKDYSEAIRLDPDDAPSWLGRGTARLDLRDFSRAVADLDRAVALDPDDPAAHRNRGLARVGLNDLAGAIDDFSGAIALDPAQPQAFLDRGGARKARGDLRGAVVDFSEAIGLDPTSATAFRARGVARAGLGDPAGALADLDRAIRLDPRYAAPLADRAWIWAAWPAAEFRDGPKAVASATKACDLTGGNDAGALEALAAALAEAGDFARAVDRQARAIEALEGPAAVEAAEGRLALYRSARPFRRPLKP